MARTAYPTNKDLEQALKSAGFTSIPEPARLNALVNAAITQFERRTGWLPFLSSGTTTSRVFDPSIVIPFSSYGNPGSSIIRLDQGLLNLEYVKVNGATRALNQDFYLYPSNRSPIVQIQFLFPVIGLPQSIEVNGTWGYSTTIPDDAWLAILRIAMIEVASEYLVNITGGLIEWNEGAAKESYGERPLAHIIDIWRDFTDKTITSYERKDVY